MYLLGSLLLYSKHEAINPILHNNGDNVRLQHKCTAWELKRAQEKRRVVTHELLPLIPEIYQYKDQRRGQRREKRNKKNIKN